MQGVELIRRLCACFGPTSLECEVASTVREELAEGFIADIIETTNGRAHTEIVGKKQEMI